MSVEIDWKALTTGPDGDALALTIRDFIHDKFQQVTLPRFIRSVRVHSFEFGDECPSVELKDVCDPLDEFYEDEDDDDDDDDDEDEGEDGNDGEVLGGDSGEGIGGKGSGDASNMHASIETLKPQSSASQPLQSRRGNELPYQLNASALSAHERVASMQSGTEAGWGTGAGPGMSFQRPGALRSLPSFVDQLASPVINGRSAGTPGIPIPGGTTNMSYFHPTPFSHHHHHHQHTFPAPWSDYNFVKPGQMQTQPQPQNASHPPPALPPLDQPTYSAGDPSTRPSTATTQTPLSRVPTGSSSQHEQHGHGVGTSRPAGSKSQHHQKSSGQQARRRRASTRDRSQGFPLSSSPPRLPSSAGMSAGGRSSERPEPNPQDMQLVLHVRYSGGVRLALSAEILLDYPMSSFVSIPLQLTITGVSFDGVAIVAHVRPSMAVEKAKAGATGLGMGTGLGAGSGAGAGASAGDGNGKQSQAANRGRAHICFLSREDARALLGADAADLASDEYEGEGEGEDGGNDEVSFDVRRSGPSHHPSSSLPLDPSGSSPSAPHLSNSNSTLTSTSNTNPNINPNINPNNQTTQTPTTINSTNKNSSSSSKENLGGLLNSIRVETEIGQRREGQQSLRNVAKVEKFVLEQVRRIFEDEFVWPSFWTFLI